MSFADLSERSDPYDACKLTDTTLHPRTGLTNVVVAVVAQPYSHQD